MAVSKSWLTVYTEKVVPILTYGFLHEDSCSEKFTVFHMAQEFESLTM